MAHKLAAPDWLLQGFSLYCRPLHLQYCSRDVQPISMQAECDTADSNKGNTSTAVTHAGTLKTACLWVPHADIHN